MKPIETNILSALMRENNLFATAEHYHLTPESFEDDAAQQIFGKIQTLLRCGEAVDMGLLANALPKLMEQIVEIETAGDAVYVHFPDWCRELKRAEARKSLLNVAVRFQQKISDPESDLAEVSTEAVSAIEAARTTAEGARERTLAEMGLELAREATTEPPENIPIFPLNTEGFQQVKLHAGEFFVLGAKTGCGKTALCAAAAVEQLRQGYNVLYCCTESGAKDILARIVAVASGIHHGDRPASPAELERYQAAIREFCRDRAKQLHILGNDNGAVTPSRIRQKLREIEADGAAQVVYVDFVQNLCPDSHLRSSLEEINASVQSVHDMLSEYRAAGIVVAQFNRESQRPEKDGRRKDPDLTWLKDTSVLEQLAHTVAFLVRGEDGGSRLICLKTRNAKRRFNLAVRWNGITYESADAYTGKYAGDTPSLHGSKA